MKISRIILLRKIKEHGKLISFTAKCTRVAWNFWNFWNITKWSTHLPKLYSNIRVYTFPGIFIVAFTLIVAATTTNNAGWSMSEEFGTPAINSRPRNAKCYVSGFLIFRVYRSSPRVPERPSSINVLETVHRGPCLELKYLKRSMKNPYKPIIQNLVHTRRLNNVERYLNET